MIATYFSSRGAGHSYNGQEARENGAMSWSNLPWKLRKYISSKQARDLRISDEWHHSGKFAQEVYVYYPEQVQKFFEVIGDFATRQQLAQYRDMRHFMTMGYDTQEKFGVSREWVEQLVQLVQQASNEAEKIRCELSGDDDDY